MIENKKFYIDGQWSAPSAKKLIDVIDPATEKSCGVVALGDSDDVNRAVESARKAFDSYSQTTRKERLEMFDRIIAEIERRAADLANAVSLELGAPAWLAEQAHVPLGLGHFQVARQVLADYVFEEEQGTTRIVKEPVGVCAFITPWNWPLNQVCCKVAPALAVGCTMVLKPSEIAPFSATIIAEILDAAGVPAGVFNLVHGDGPGVGAALSSHPDVDMVSFTGSTRAGVEVAKAAADTVKRVHQELGGKSPNIILPSADLNAAIQHGVAGMMMNSGQSCNAPSRMLVPADKMEEAARIAAEAASEHTVGAPASNAKLGPVVSEAQWNKIQGLIEKGVSEGASVVAGGLGRPDDLPNGYYVKPTVFANVTNDQTIAREEIFGPVLVLIGYEDVEDAINIANDTPYGLAAYISGDHAEAKRVAARLRAGQVYLNGAPVDVTAPFGGFKQSGNGREWGPHAFADFLELKAVIGDIPA